VQHERRVVAGTQVAPFQLLPAQRRHDVLHERDADRIVGILAHGIARRAPGVLPVATAGEEPERILQRLGPLRQACSAQAPNDRGFGQDLLEVGLEGVSAKERGVRHERGARIDLPVGVDGQGIPATVTEVVLHARDPVHAALHDLEVIELRPGGLCGLDRLHHAREEPVDAGEEPVHARARAAPSKRPHQVLARGADGADDLGDQRQLVQVVPGRHRGEGHVEAQVGEQSSAAQRRFERAGATDAVVGLGLRSVDRHLETDLLAVEGANGGFDGSRQHRAVRQDDHLEISGVRGVPDEPDQVFPDEGLAAGDVEPLQPQLAGPVYDRLEPLQGQPGLLSRPGRDEAVRAAQVAGVVDLDPKLLQAFRRDQRRAAWVRLTGRRPVPEHPGAVHGMEEVVHVDPGLACLQGVCLGVTGYQAREGQVSVGSLDGVQKFPATAIHRDPVRLRRVDHVGHAVLLKRVQLRETELCVVLQDDHGSFGAHGEWFGYQRASVCGDTPAR
jgi:hypothetical protein